MTGVTEMLISKSGEIIFGAGYARTLCFYCKAKTMLGHSKVVHSVFLLNDRGQCYHQLIEVLQFRYIDILIENSDRLFSSSFLFLANIQKQLYS